MKLFKFEFSRVLNEERVYETILFETDSYNSTTEESVEGFLVEHFYTNSFKISTGQYEFLRQIFEEDSVCGVERMMNLPGARFIITEVRTIKIK